MRKIIWSDFAEIDYEENITYLTKEWTVEDALNFVESTEDCLGIITKSPKIFPDKKGGWI